MGHTARSPGLITGGTLKNRNIKKKKGVHRSVERDIRTENTTVYRSLRSASCLRQISDARHQTFSPKRKPCYLLLARVRGHRAALKTSTLFYTGSQQLLHFSFRDFAGFPVLHFAVNLFHLRVIFYRCGFFGFSPALFLFAHYF